MTDCLCLFTKNLSEKGGRSILASAYTVYNEIAATRPDIIHTLAESNWPFDTYVSAILSHETVFFSYSILRKLQSHFDDGLTNV